MRHGVASGASCEASLNTHITPHLNGSREIMRECTGIRATGVLSVILGLEYVGVYRGSSREGGKGG